MKSLFLILLLIILLINCLNLKIKETFITSIKVSNSDKYLLNIPKYTYKINKLKKTLSDIELLDNSTNVLNYDEDYSKYYNYDLSNHLMFDLNNNITVDNNICCKSPNCNFLINIKDSWRLKRSNNLSEWSYCCSKCRVSNGESHGSNCQHMIARKCKS
tara:strand:+ start:185 stop:661 length:477 start_codon:yes stop_codon:yes gene_type:complete